MGESVLNPLDTEVSFVPGDLPAFYRTVSGLSGRDRSLSLSRIHLGESALDEMLPAISRLGPGDRVVLLADTTLKLRGSNDLWAEVNARLQGQDLPVIRILVPGDSHTTAELVDEVADQLRGGDVVVSVGSGTVTDVAKHAVHSSGGSMRHLAVATANSVGAYTSALAVVTTRGVKRTVPSRLPDELVLDTQVLASAPEGIALGGVGDAAVGWGSLADYRLASLCGMGGWEPVTVPVFLPGLRAFLRRDPEFTAGGTSTAAAMARNLCAAGFAMSFAGESAPASGLEHVTSHVLDMTAARDGRVIGNHGEQCGLATVLSLLAYQYLLGQVEVAGQRLVAPDLASVEAQVRSAFGPLGGQIADECWSDAQVKTLAWTTQLQRVQALLDDWEPVRAELLPLLAEPLDYLRALHATGHPLRFEDVEPGGITDPQARFAFANARLMRKRLSVADFLDFLGMWTPELVDALFVRFVTLRDQVLAEG